MCVCVCYIFLQGNEEDNTYDKHNHIKAKVSSVWQSANPTSFNR